VGIVRQRDAIDAAVPVLAVSGVVH
jgi:hypothetical protein